MNVNVMGLEQNGYQEMFYLPLFLTMVRHFLELPEVSPMAQIEDGYEHAEEKSKWPLIWSEVLHNTTATIATAAATTTQAT